MPQLNWEEIVQQFQPQKKRYAGANVRFFNAYNENPVKSLEAGRPIFDEIPSISIQYPGMDETVRRVEPQDIAEYPEKWAAFHRGQEPVVEGTPLSEWTPMNGSAMRELQYMGFKTVEQLAAAPDDVRRRLGPLVKFCKMAQTWLESANSTQSQVVSLKQQLEREKHRTAQLEEKMDLLMQRIEANEAVDLRPQRKEVIRVSEPLVEDPFLDDVIEKAPSSFEELSEPTSVPQVKKRGRPKKSA